MVTKVFKIENYFTGFGIKKMKAYKTNLTFDELQKLRADFWSIYLLIQTQRKTIKGFGKFLNNAVKQMLVIVDLNRLC